MRMRHTLSMACKAACACITENSQLAQTAQAFSLACIAEAQALTVLRAIQKGNAPTLIASLAADASAAFKSAAGTAGGVVSGGKADSKFVLYAEYQAAAMEALALAFTGAALPLYFTRDTLCQVLQSARAYREALAHALLDVTLLLGLIGQDKGASGHLLELEISGAVQSTCATCLCDMVLPVTKDYMVHRPGQSDVAAGRHRPGLSWEGKVPAGGVSERQQGVRQGAACDVSH